MNNLKRIFVNQTQRFHRRLNSAYLEGIYQTSYLSLAQRCSWLDEIPLASPNGGTASFSLLYIVLSILKDNAVTRLMELGVGQSTNLLMQYADNFETKLMLIDDNEYWLKTVIGERKGMDAVYAALSSCEVEGKAIQWYGCLQPKIKVDFLLVDGPMAYKKGIRYNRFGIIDWLPQVLNEEFIIVIDDTNRVGEYQLVKAIVSKLTRQGIKVGVREIVGANSQTIIATEKFTKYTYL